MRKRAPVSFFGSWGGTVNQLQLGSLCRGGEKEKPGNRKPFSIAERERRRLRTPHPPGKKKGDAACNLRQKETEREEEGKKKERADSNLFS